jgi:hypothetical protein
MQNQAVTAASNALTDTGILKQVLSFLPGHHLFLSAVCREWRAVYAGIADQQMRLFNLYNFIGFETCGNTTTLFSAVVASPATVRLAHESGVQISTNEKVQLMAGKHAYIKTLAALQELGMPLSQNLLQAAAVSGRLSILQHLISEQHCPKPRALVYYAACGGNISLLIWLRTEQQCEFDEYTCTGAAARGQLAALKYLRSEGCDWDAANVAHSAAHSGSKEMVEWLQQQQGLVFGADAMASAAGADLISMCEYLHSTGCEWDERACTDAARNGSLDTLRWLRENGCPWDVIDVFDHAAHNSQTGILDLI